MEDEFDSRPKSPSKEFLKAEENRLKALKKEEERIRKSDLKLQKELEREDKKWHKELQKDNRDRKSSDLQRKPSRSFDGETKTQDLEDKKRERKQNEDRIKREQKSKREEEERKKKEQEEEKRRQKEQEDRKKQREVDERNREKSQLERQKHEDIKQDQKKKQKPIITSTPPIKKSIDRPKQTLIMQSEQITAPSRTHHIPSSKPKDISPTEFPIFNVQFEIKNITMSFQDSIRVKALITNTNRPDFKESLLYKLYLVDSENNMFLLDVNFKPIKNTAKLSFSSKFNEDIPPQPQFKFRVVILLADREIFSVDSQDINVNFEGVSKLINFTGITVYSNIIIPENSFVFWLNFTTKAIPINQNLHVQAAIEAKNLKIAEHTYSFQVSGSDKNSFSKKVYTMKVGSDEIEHRLKFQQPFSIAIPDFHESIMKAKLIVTVSDEQRNPIYKKERPLLGLNHLKGIKIAQITYNKETEINQPAYMIAEIQNKTLKPIKGKCEFFFFNLLTDLIPAFTRKFHVDAKNYEKVTEDIYLAPILSGRTYWVICRAKIKTKHGTFLIESISHPATAPIPKSAPYKIAMRTVVHDDGVYFNSIIPVGIDTQLNFSRKVKNISCEIIENYGNVSKKILKRVKIKNLDAANFTLHWKVPPKLGDMWLDTNLLIDGIPVIPENITKQTPQFQILPKPKRKKSD